MMQHDRRGDRRTSHSFGMSSLGYPENLVAAASYFGPLNVLVLSLEKESEFVRFHAIQSVLSFSLILALWVLTKALPGLHFLIWAPGLLSLVLCLYMMPKAYEGEAPALPFIGQVAFEHAYESHRDYLATDPEPSETGRKRGLRLGRKKRP